MKRSFIGAMAAGLMVAGAAVAMTPAVASAATISSYESAIIDPTGAPQPTNSPFGNKFQVRVVSNDVSDGKTCTFTLYNNGNDKPLSKSTFSLRSTDGLFIGTKTTTALKTGSYYADTRCGSDSRQTVFTITNAPPLVISGLASCYQSDQGKFIRPNGLTVDNGIATKVRLSSTTETVGSAPKGTVSKFSVELYNPGPYTATLTCGGTASKPQRSFTFPDTITAPNNVQLIAD